MDRWWTDPEASVKALARVDDSNPVQGVGTAVLAYHGLAEGVLRPLATRTLMDVASVSKALESIDIAPVAKALAAATKPVMGDSSEAYGQILASDIHAQAVDSTSRLIQNLVSTGMGWPAAIDRATKVHGVPTDRLGQVGGKLRAPAIQKLAADDLADRALMEYASHVGLREGTNEFISKAYLEREFHEEDVFRDVQGRFSDKPDKSLKGLKSLSDPTLADRQRKRALREKKKDKIAEVKNRQANDLSSLAQMLTAREKPVAAQVEEKKQASKPAAEDDLENEVMNRALKRAVDKRVAAAVEALANRKRLTVDDVPDSGFMESTAKKDEYDVYPGWTGGSNGQQQFILASKAVLEKAAENGQFTWEGFRKAGGGLEPDLLTRDELRDVVLDYSYGNDDTLDDLAVVVFDGDVAYSESYTQGRDTRLADPGKYRVSGRNEAVGLKGLEMDDIYDMDLKVYVAPGNSRSPKSAIELPHLTVKLDNDKDFRSIPGGFQKSWDELEHPRDGDGKFTESRRGQLVRIDAKERRKKLAAKRSRVQNAQARQDAKTFDLTAALQARTGEQKAVEARAAEKTVARSNDDVMEEFILRRAEKKALEQAAARSKEKILARQEELDDYRETHEDLKELKALQFGSDENVSIVDMFGMNPRTGDEHPTGWDTKGAEEHEDFLDFHMDRLKPSTALVERMHNYPPRGSLGEEIPAWDDDVEEPAPYFNTPWDAFYFANSVAEAYNSDTPVSDDFHREYMPAVKFAENQMYTPWLREVYRGEEDTVVLGSDKDWSAVRRGEKVTLEPLDGFDTNGSGSFDYLFSALGSDEDFKKYLDLHQRSDYYVRAFRIKT